MLRRNTIDKIKSTNPCLQKIDITKEDIRPCDELMVESDSVEATYELWFDADAYFGTNTRENDSVWINFYTIWHPKTDSISACYVIDSPDGNEDHEWELSEKEQQFFHGLMEKYAIYRYGKTLSELVQDCVKDRNAKPEKAQIKITYSWGDEEPAIDCESIDSAWERAKKMAVDEAETAGDEHDCEIGLTFETNDSEKMIILHYLYDDEYCYYRISKKQE